MYREEIIKSVLVDGSRLRDFEYFKDDDEVVAAAILGNDLTDESILQYASERLQNNKKMLKLVSIATKLKNLKASVLHSGASQEEIAKYIQQIEEKKKSIVKENFVSKKQDETLKLYLEKIDVSDEEKTLIDRAVIGTKLNHPDFNMGRSLGYEVYSILLNFVNNPRANFRNDLFNRISSQSEIYGISLRNTIGNYYKVNSNYPIICDYGKDRDINDVSLPPSSLFSLDLLKLAIKRSSLIDEKREKILRFLEGVDFYLAADEFARVNHEDITVAMRAKAQMQQSLKDISSTEIVEVFNDYFDTLDAKDVFRDDSIVIDEITETAREVLTNASEIALKDSFHAVLLNGKIDMASDKGYKGYTGEQEDAVGSVVRDDNQFINIVADGVGQAKDGAMGSKILVEELSNWYRSLSKYVLDDVSALIYSLEVKLAEINRDLVRQYGEEAQTTLVLALTAGDKTIIANVGDSTAYAYDEDNDRLEELTVLDSYSYGLDYESARHNPENNVITASLGHAGRYELHTKVISNNGQRIILSSDGVTDLISENNFKDIFRRRIDAQHIVNKAKYYPDVSGNMKGEDNISAIVIDLPENAYGIGRGR